MQNLHGVLTLAVALALVQATLVTDGHAQDAAPAWMAQIRPDHPRLFLNSEMWPQVRERALTVERGYYEAMKKHADTSTPGGGWWAAGGDPASLQVPGPREGSEVDVRDWGLQALSAAFVYRMEPSPERLKRIRDMLWASLDYYHACYQQNKSVHWYAYSRLGWLAAMDWVWNDLDPQERAKMGRSMLQHVDDVLHKPNIARRNTGAHTTGYYGGRNITLFAGLLFYNEGIDDEAAREYLLEGWGVYERLLQHRAQMAGDDGGTASPTLTYSVADYPLAEWNLIYAMRSATGVDLAAEWTYLAMMPNYVLWNWLPGGLEFGYGDVHHLTNEFPRSWIYTHMSNLMNMYAQTQPEWAAVAATVREMVGGSMSLLASGKTPYPLLLTEIPQVPEPLPLDELGLPMARHFESLGQTFMRSGVGEGDTYALFACGGLTGQHRHYDANHFTIYKRGYLALDTGTRRGNTDNLQNYYAQTIAHNSILIKMPGEAPSRYWNGEVYDQAGGQSKSVGSEVIAFETGPQFSYVAGDATPVYHEDKCAMAVRQFIFLPPDHFVVFDRVVSKDAGFAKTWLLHHANEPVLDGNTWHADQGEGRIFCRTLLPEDARLEPVGGPGREFLVEGVNYSLTGGPAAWVAETGARVGTLDYEEVPELMGRWRVEVTPGAARTDDVFLHLIQVGDQSLTEMSDAEVGRDADGNVTLSFDASGRTVNLLLPISGDIGGWIRIAEGQEVVVDRALTSEVLHQEGLAIE